jgi:CRISPR/Cas system CMR-associated protein Cmr1 (group 7 of RAMP superfamily)
MWCKSEDLKAWTKVESFESVVQKLEEMASKKKQDEKNLKLLRELVSLPCNKHCFDCQQRGPTYVNMTIGSFVCTSCSGLL